MNKNVRLHVRTLFWFVLGVFIIGAFSACTAVVEDAVPDIESTALDVEATPDVEDAVLDIETTPDIIGEIAVEDHDEPVCEDLEIRIGLENFSLIARDPAGSDLLEAYTLHNDFAEIQIITITGADMEIFETDTLVVDAFPIQLRYRAIPSVDVVSEAERFYHFTIEFMTATVEVIRRVPSFIQVNDTHSAAVLGIALEFTTDSFDYDAPYVYIYMVQDIPNSEYMVELGMILGIDFFTEKDFAIIEELGSYFGIDLMAYIEL